MSSLKVVYIAGCARSGSTIVDRLLGTLEGVASFNEVTGLTENCFVNDHFCSCGERFRSCRFWRDVVAEAFPQESDIHDYLYLNRRIDHRRYFLSFYSGYCSDEFRTMLQRYREHLRRVYFALSNISGRQILIDSSKSPTRALMLDGIEGMQVHVLHLIRDVRAHMYAFQKKRLDPGRQKLMRRFNPFEGVAYWYLINGYCEKLASRFPYSRMLYEDFAANPGKVLQSFIDACELLQGKRLAVDATGQVYLKSVHSLQGNPHRFVSGPTKIVADDEYKHRLNANIKVMGTMLAFPFLKRYGYSLRME